MIQLVAFGQTDSSGYFLDIDSNEDINLNFSVAEIKDFSSRQSSFSNTFSLPFTDANNDFFNHLYNVNLATGSFDVYQRTECEIRVDGLTQLQGYLFITSVNLTSENYSVSVIGEVGNLKDELGEKKLSDLDSDWLANFTHALTKDNIVDSWDFNINYTNTNNADVSGIVYPFINYGIDNRVWTLGGSNSIKSSSTPIQPYEFKPAFRVKTLFDRIIAEAGYSYDSNFFDNDDFEFDKVFMNLASENERVNYRPINEGFLAGLSSDQNISAPRGVFTTIEFANEIYDPEGNFDSGAYAFTAPNSGRYAFIVNAVLDFTATGGEPEATYTIAYNVNGNDWISSIGQFSGSGSTTISQPIALNLDLGDVLKVNIEAYETTAKTALTNFVVELSSDTFFQLTAQPSLPQGNAIYLEDNLPNIRQVDFVKAIFEHFNMFIDPKQDNPTELLIEPYPDYMDRGVSLDWTDKLDYNKEVQIIPTTEFRQKSLKWEWLEGTSYTSVYAQNNRKYNYGSYTIEDTSDLTAGEFKNFTTFSEPCGRLIPTSGQTLPFKICMMDLSSRDKDSNVVPNTDTPRIFYFKKLDLSNSETYYLFDEATEVADATNSYGYAGHLSTIPASSGTYDLNWSNQSPIYNQNELVSSLSNLNPFIQYWKQYLNEIYSDEARLLKGKFYLTPVDIHNLRFNNKIFVRDSFYRVNKINNYKPNTDESCDVELIRLGVETGVGLSTICDIVPSTFNQDGTIDFIDGEGASATITKDCCEGYGYTFVNGEPAKCYWRKLDGFPDTPFNGDGINAPE